MLSRVFSTILTSALVLGLIACGQPGREVEEDSDPAPAPAAQHSAPAVLPGLSRAELLGAINQAASDYAAGLVRDESDPLVGRTFSVTMAFGCGGPIDELDPAVDMSGLPMAVWGPERMSIDLRLTPTNWTQSPLIAGDGEDSRWEAVEGFWLARPWLMADGCPASRSSQAGARGATGSPQTMGIAAIFEEGGSRIGRRNGRPYSFTIRSEGDAELVAPAQGYRLVLEGRTVAFPDGRAVRCQANSLDVRPGCVVTSRLDRVAFETADGKLLSEWGSS